MVVIITRKEKRNLIKDKNLVENLYRIIKKYFPWLLTKFNNLTDTRHQSYVEYNMKTICVTKLFGLLCGIASMKGIDDEFNTFQTLDNLSLILLEQLKDIPHSDTISDVFENISIEELRDIQKHIVTTLIRSKMFDNFRYKNAFQLVVDATGLSSHDYNLNDNCLSKTSKTGVTTYYKYVLECKIVVGSIVISLDSEFIENSICNNENDKQDCEVNAFKRMALRIKKNYPKQKFIITGDALYATTPIIDICNDNNWFYIFNLKKDRLKTVYEDFIDNINYCNESNKTDYFLSTGYVFNDNKFNILKFIEHSKKKDTSFHYITNLKVNDDNIETIVHLGRQRWRIENEGFYTQKHGTFNITHMCSRNDNAMKAHYFFIQFAHTIRQLLEKGDKLIKELKLKIKEVSAFLLKSLTSSPSSLNQLDLSFQLRFDMLIL